MIDERDDMVFDDGERPMARLEVFSRSGERYALPAHPEETFTIEGTYDEDAEQEEEDYDDTYDLCDDPDCDECYG